MRTRIRAGRVVVLAVVLTAAGCHTFEPSTPVTVQVRDAETQAPVPGATVHLWRLGSHASDRDQSFTTASNGSASAHLAPPDEGGVMVEVTAPNHLASKPTPLPPDVVDALASAKPFHPYKGPPLSVTVDVYAGPRPTAELVLPVGFRGLVKAEIRVLPNGSYPAGQRVFTYMVPANGVVEVSGPPVFDLGVGPDFVAKFADGTTPLPKDPPKGEDVGLRWLSREPTVVYFVVGTAADAAAARSALGHGSGYSEGSGSKSGQGGGRGSGIGGARGMSGIGGRGGMGGGRGGMGGP